MNPNYARLLRAISDAKEKRHAAQDSETWHKWSDLEDNQASILFLWMESFGLRKLLEMPPAQLESMAQMLDRGWSGTTDALVQFLAILARLYYFIEGRESLSILALLDKYMVVQ
jgi:hypothetical protein